MANNKMTIVLCEGESEVAYVQELNRFLRENECDFKFVPKLVGCGYYTSVYKKFREERKNNPKSIIKVILDDDLYVRNDNAKEIDNSTKYAESPIKNEMLFNTHNFEDVLMLHCDDSILNQWLATCVKHNHMKVPMHSEEYEPLVRNFFPGYEKGTFPFSEINQDMLDNLFRHNEDTSIFIKSDFATFLNGLLNNP